MHSVKKNAVKAWILATRPKTLAAGSVPVVVASALAFRTGVFKLLPAVLCLLFALLAQIASNFSNDYYDFVKKTDNENRMGPPRAVASGWITPRGMLVGTFLVVVLACVFGLGLVFYGGWLMIVVGAVCVLALLAYTGGPWPLAYHGLGDLFVLVFFGLVAVVFSYYVQTQMFHPLAFVGGGMVGLGAVNILVLNNYRDRENDRESNKKTTVVLFGEPFGRWFYFLNGVGACMLSLLFFSELGVGALFPFLYLFPHYRTWKKMIRIHQGRELNPLLGETSRNLLILGFLLTLSLLFG